MPLFIKAAAFESAELKIEPMSLGGVVRARTALFFLESKGDDVLLESKEPKTRGFRFPRTP